MKIDIYEGNRLVFSGDCAAEKALLIEKNKASEKEVDASYEYFRSGDNIRIDILDMINADILDGGYTINVYWIMCIIKNHGILRKISPENAVKLGDNVLPMMEAFLSLNKLKLKRSTEALFFAEVTADERERFLADECSADEAMEKILSALPSKRSVRETLKAHPRYKDVLNAARYISKFCAVQGYTEAIEDFVSEFLDDESK